MAPAGGPRQLPATIRPWVLGFLTGAGYAAILAVVAAAAQATLYGVYELCLDRSLRDLSRAGPATGCVPPAVFAVLWGLIAGPVVLTMIRWVTARTWPMPVFVVLSIVLFGLVGALSFGLTGLRLGRIILLIVVLAGQLAAALFMLLFII